jgi:hypothetical protein
MERKLQGILEKRRAQAEVIKPIYEVLVERFGKAEAQGILEASIRQAAIEEGKRYAEMEPGPPGLAQFAALQPLWLRSGALEVLPLGQTETEFAFDVTRCKYAEMYIEMGLGEIGHLLSCNRDATFCEGYNPRIRLTRTQTIMQGADHCDFRYEIEPTPPSKGIG